MSAMLETGVPVSFGVLTTYNAKQAKARSKANAENKGREAALACWSSALTLKKIGESEE
jgi:6,7-dimethyl-8-ribityllumazine synthase